MSIGNNKVVTINFTLKDQFDNIIDSTTTGKPFQYLSGHQNILPKLESEIDSMLIGSKKTIDVSAAEAYGEYDDEAVQILKKEEFPPNILLEVGKQYIQAMPDGSEIPFTITEINSDDVTIDFNHPLAGLDLVFEVELLEVRDATSEEISQGYV